MKSDDYRAIVLSAPSCYELELSIKILSKYIEDFPSIEVNDLAFTTQRSMTSYSWRWGCVASRLSQVRAHLETASVSDFFYSSSSARFNASELNCERDRLHAWLLGELKCWEPETSQGSLVDIPHLRFSLGGTSLSQDELPGIPSQRVLKRYSDAYKKITGKPLSLGELSRPINDLDHCSSFTDLMAEELSKSFPGFIPKMFSEYETIADTLKFLESGRGGEGRPAGYQNVSIVDAAESDSERSNESVAIVGMAGLFPGAEDLTSFWDSLICEKVALSPAPPDHPCKAKLPWQIVAGFLEHIDDFDPEFFRINPRDAELMDPQERLFLQTAWRCLEDAGYPPYRLRKQFSGNVGVFAATMYSDYSFIGVEELGLGNFVSTGSSTSGIANRVSFAFDLCGPSITVDTMCSASLTAIHLAVRALRAEECEAALVGGVNIITHPMRFVEQRQLGMTSQLGRCIPFGENADGIVPGEGVGVLMLKPLLRALADGDEIHGIIRGTAIGHSGTTGAYQVPSARAQATVINAALEDAGIKPEEVDYVEAHGTGTKVGDPVEIEALTQVFGSSHKLTLGSVKSNIGHLEGAAGVAGVIKLILQMKHNWIAPSIVGGELSTLIDWQQSGIEIAVKGSAWSSDLETQAHSLTGGVSSFGAGGSLAHVLISSSTRQELRLEPELDPRRQAIIVSAKNQESLIIQIKNLVDFFEKVEESVAEFDFPASKKSINAPVASSALIDTIGYYFMADEHFAESRFLRDVAYTLQTRREPFKERAACVASTLEEAIASLKEILEAGKCLRSKNEEIWETCKRWISGELVDWDRFWQKDEAKMVPLPGYPLENRRYWHNPDVRYPGTRAMEELARGELASIPGQKTNVKEIGDSLISRIIWEPLSELPKDHQEDNIRFIALVDQTTDQEVIVELSRKKHRIIHMEDVKNDMEGYSEWFAANLVKHEAIVDFCDLNPLSFSYTWKSECWRLIQSMVRIGLPMRWIHLCESESATISRAGGGLQAGFIIGLSAELPNLSATVFTTSAEGTDLVRQVEEIVFCPILECLCIEGQFYKPRVYQEPLLELRNLPALDPNRPYFISGGTGVIGQIVSKHLVDLGARRIVLCGLREPNSTVADEGDSARMAEHVAALARAGAEVEIFTGPFSTVKFKIFCEGIAQRWGKWAGIIHCAGRVRKIKPFGTIDISDMIEVVEAKTSLWELGTSFVSIQEPPDFVILFSSIASSYSDSACGLADYAAGNRYLDNLARQKIFANSVSISWPQWQASGTSSKDLGLSHSDTISVSDALHVLDLAMTGAIEGHVLVNPSSSTKDSDFRQRTTCDDQEEVVAQSPPRSLPTLEEYSRSNLIDIPQSIIRDLCDVSGIDFANTASDARLSELGIGSIVLAEMVAILEENTGLNISIEEIDISWNILQLWNWCHSKCIGLNREESRSRRSHNETSLIVGRQSQSSSSSGFSNHSHCRLAVVGIGCNFPGGATNSRLLWENLISGKDSVSNLAHIGRYLDSSHGYYDNQGISKYMYGGFISGVEYFDPEAFGLNEEEALALDPCARLILEEIESCLRDAGYHREEIRGLDFGVFVGARLSEYRSRVRDLKGFAGIWGDQNFLAALPSKVYDLRGTSLVVDTACSSALTALSLAQLSLQDKAVSAAFVVGVDYLLTDEPYREFGEIGALSSSGRCRVFDSKADGFVPGEGCGVVLVKRLDDAISAGDRIYSVIDAVSVCNDGSVMGFTTPSSTGQESAIRSALSKSGYSPEDVGMIEAHGTATLVGDPIEIRALSRVFKAVKEHACAIGSIKSNIGHLFNASGIAGLIKAILAVSEGIIPPTLHCHNPNPKLAFESSPFYPVTTPTNWNANSSAPRVAGVSSFGLGGTNCHVIVSSIGKVNEDVRQPLPRRTYKKRYIWVDASGQSRFSESGQSTRSSLLSFDYDTDAHEF